MTKAAELAALIGLGDHNLKIGDASAADSKIVFDGNAVDYHVGLDDSTDLLTIGKGSALGTTAHMTFNADGEILKPLQPSFSVNPASAQNNFAANGSNVEIVFGTENYDVGANFASNTFTAPVTGKYLLTTNIYTLNLDSAATYYVTTISTSNRTYLNLFDPDFGQDAVYWTHVVSAVADMDANDTAKVLFSQSGGTAQTDIQTSSRFTGILIG